MPRLLSTGLAVTILKIAGAFVDRCIIGSIEKGGNVLAATEDTKTARYNLVLPKDLYNELQSAAKDQGITLVQLLRKFITLGLTMLKIMERNPDASIIIEEGEKQTRLLLF